VFPSKKEPFYTFYSVFAYLTAQNKVGFFIGTTAEAKLLTVFTPAKRKCSVAKVFRKALQRSSTRQLFRGKHATRQLQNPVMKNCN